MTSSGQASRILRFLSLKFLDDTKHNKNGVKNSLSPLFRHSSAPGDAAEFESLGQSSGNRQGKRSHVLVKPLGKSLVQKFFFQEHDGFCEEPPVKVMEHDGCFCGHRFAALVCDFHVFPRAISCSVRFVNSKLRPC